MALGIAAPPAASAYEVYAPRPSVPSIIGLQIAQDEGEPALAPQLNDAADAAAAAVEAAAESAAAAAAEDAATDAAEDAVEAAPVDSNEPALAPQKDKLNPSEEIKKAVESATGAQSEDKGDGANPSEEIKKAVESATGSPARTYFSVSTRR